jgi:hypothetical protein
MRSSVFVKLRTSCLLFGSVALAVFLVEGSPANARGPALVAWEALYGGVSGSSDVAQCAVCHETNPGDASWNQYGWDIFSALSTPGCDAT